MAKILKQSGALLLLPLLSTSLYAGGSETRTVTAHVAAIDQQYVYNRFGAFNPVGMMYALCRDLVDKTTGHSDPQCIGLTPGNVMLREERRPRPLVLRGNVGDTLQVNFTNLLSIDPPSGPPEPEVGEEDEEGEEPSAGGDAPNTRDASMAVAGLVPNGDNHNCLNNGQCGIAPGSSTSYSWTLQREGAYLFTSLSAPAGGEGDGGSTVLRVPDYGSDDTLGGQRERTGGGEARRRRS